MYWRRSGNRSIGRAMLKKIFLLTTLLLSFNALACWKVEGELAVDGESWKINQKFIHNKDYSFPMGTFILTLSIKPGEKNNHQLKYSLMEKKGITQVLVTKGEDVVSEKETEEIFAKGVEGQPNSIITIKITNI